MVCGGGGGTEFAVVSMRSSMNTVLGAVSFPVVLTSKRFVVVLVVVVIDAAAATVV